MLPIRTSLIIGVGLKLRENWRKEVEPLPAPLRYAGFTLIELSIALVIIGLLVGGVLVGQDLIKAAQIRKHISFIEATNAAANTFRIKYSAMVQWCAHKYTTRCSHACPLYPSMSQYSSVMQAKP